MRRISLVRPWPVADLSRVTLLPGHSLGFPVRLDSIATGKLEPNGTTLIDFIITNIEAEPIKLPFSIDGNISSPRTILTLYLTSDAIEYGHLQSGEPILPWQPTSAELYARSDDRKTFYLLAPSKAIRAHASSRFQVKPGTHSLTAHAQLLTEVVSSSGVTGEVLGTAEVSTSRQNICKSHRFCTVSSLSIPKTRQWE
jgi:hypothetical protein